MRTIAWHKGVFLKLGLKFYDRFLAKIYRWVPRRQHGFGSQLIWLSVRGEKLRFWAHILFWALSTTFDWWGCPYRGLSLYHCSFEQPDKLGDVADHAEILLLRRNAFHDGAADYVRTLTTSDRF